MPLRDDEIRVIRQMIAEYDYTRRHAALRGRLVSRAQVGLAALLGCAMLAVNLYAVLR